VEEEYDGERRRLGARSGWWGRRNGQLREGSNYGGRMNDTPNGLGKLFPESRLRVFRWTDCKCGLRGAAVPLCN
jgi:hypothetical protein